MYYMGLDDTNLRGEQVFAEPYLTVPVLQVRGVGGLGLLGFRVWGFWQDKVLESFQEVLTELTPQSRMLQDRETYDDHYYR